MSQIPNSNLNAMHSVPAYNPQVGFGIPSSFLPPPSMVMQPPPTMPLANIPPWHNSVPVQYAYQDGAMSYSSCSTNQVENGTKSDDQLWVNSWLKQIGKTEDGEKKPNNSIKIHEVKEILSVALNIIAELENASATLNVMAKSVTDAEWAVKCREIDDKQEELNQLLSVLKMDPFTLSDIMKKLNKRKSKRDRLKRQSAKRNAERKAIEENRKKLHVQIDSWLEDMKESVERTRREEELKREADSVLWEVTQKKTEARKQISLLSSLLKLRQAKAAALKSSGKYVSETEITTYNTIIEKLMSMWERQLEGYLLEEQGLRVMLTEDEERKNPQRTQVKQVLNEWEIAIFGKKCNETVGEPQNVEELVEVRRSWDQFITNNTMLMASTIPVGWVLPVEPSDKNWAQCLKHNVEN